ncbi:hypothetical protein [Brevibacillus laterosporus]|uniref:Uncharacterized protein n=1 Tax=Brevibacillus laterosporus TaxID=1465 RepID=A0AAP3DKG6_BRELA|nr:hypothetical protein [Brevibacillus laterosporus]MBM7111080.1 hypothetical protein [Brevibacillus laterosporus]MCR8936350.1 hypothetical protein [Brevibacillus laterosporus]MCR8982572.1 hypothetical protein [Brevibacillus laterosporus]MCZ0809728.1 hypothetical protein [Brevibacillus laterosporus]MCZ0828322.1 hypothetical protein [Brevibacillus laterosporus]
MDSKQRSAKEEPTIAPSMNGHDPLEEKASTDEVEKGEYTSVTKLFLDRTPKD